MSVLFLIVKILMKIMKIYDDVDWNKSNANNNRNDTYDRAIW